MNTQINFGGFYESHHHYIVEQAIAFAFGCEDPETGEIDHNKLFDVCGMEWQQAEDEYCQRWIDKLNDELETNFILESVNRPREYKFRTDVIMAKYSYEDYTKVMLYVAENGLIREVDKRFKEATTPRSGYMPFYSFEDLISPGNEHMRLQLRLDVIIKHLEHDYPFICEDFYL